MKFLVWLLVVPAVFAGEKFSIADKWVQNCAKCHGNNGNGNTKLGLELKVKDYTKPLVLANLSNLNLRSSIADGKDRMPAYKETFSQNTINSFIEYIRRLNKQCNGCKRL